MNIGIIGLGLIGGSLGKAFIKKTDHLVYGTDIDADIIKKALLVNAITHKLTDDDYNKIDLLIFAVTPNVFLNIAADVVKRLKANTTVMDIGGNKSIIVDEMKRLSHTLPHLNFVATHPMAGKETYGIAHSSASLFEKASILLIPVNSELKLLSTLKGLFCDIGFDFVKITSCEEHDKMIAYTSQLPHIISSCYVDNPVSALHDGFSAGSFRDLTRVAKMNPQMWTELFLQNKDNLLLHLDILINNLLDIKLCLETENEQLLLEKLTANNDMKEKIDANSRQWKKDNNLK